MKTYIAFPRVEGRASRQAHANLPEGTYEREISKEGFFGPAAFLHHRRPPTGWVKFEGPLRPRAFDLARLQEAQASPWAAPVVLRNAATEVRFRPGHAASPPPASRLRPDPSATRARILPGPRPGSRPGSQPSSRPGCSARPDPSSDRSLRLPRAC